MQAPYEEPTNPELILDTEKHTPQECLQIILSRLQKQDILPKHIIHISLYF
ncbi:MAG: hypothetical protein ACRD9Q_10895 [Nitrososphaeraceae archaeon]